MAKKPNTTQEAPREGQPLTPVAAVVVHNRRTGAIFCTHYFSVIGGAKLPDAGELERLAVDHAVRDGCNVRTHSTLLVDPVKIARGVAYRVVKGKLTKVRAEGRGPKSIAPPRAKALKTD